MATSILAKAETESIIRRDGGFREPVAYPVPAAKDLTLKHSRANIGLANVPLFKLTSYESSDLVWRQGHPAVGGNGISTQADGADRSAADSLARYEIYPRYGHREFIPCLG